MKVIIAGSRTYTRYDVLERVMSKLRTIYDIDTVISGTARGADQLGERYAHLNGLKLERYPADWNTYGRRAGYIRNAEMVRQGDILVALWDGTSKGTKNTIDLARKKNIPRVIVKSS